MKPFYHLLHPKTCVEDTIAQVRPFSFRTSYQDQILIKSDNSNGYMHCALLACRQPDLDSQNRRVEGTSSEDIGRLTSGKTHFDDCWSPCKASPALIVAVALPCHGRPLPYSSARMAHNTTRPLLFQHQKITLISPSHLSPLTSHLIFHLILYITLHLILHLTDIAIA